jgi:Mg2+ and Co2+ transporter CorA
MQKPTLRVLLPLVANVKQRNAETRHNDQSLQFEFRRLWHMYGDVEEKYSADFTVVKDAKDRLDAHEASLLRSRVSMGDLKGEQDKAFKYVVTTHLLYEYRRISLSILHACTFACSSIESAITDAMKRQEEGLAISIVCMRLIACVLSCRHEQDVIASLANEVNKMKALIDGFKRELAAKTEEIGELVNEGQGELNRAVDSLVTNEKRIPRWVHKVVYYSIYP